MHTNSTFYVRKTQLRVSALVLVMALLCGVLGIISINTGETFAAPSENGGGSNDIAQNDYMIADSKTSGNDDILPPVPPTAANPNPQPQPMGVPGWEDYLNTQFHTQGLSKFFWADAADMGTNVSPAWTGGRASVANNGAAGSQTNVNMIPYLNGTTYEIWSAEQLFWALTQTRATLVDKTVRLMRNIDLDGSDRNWIQIFETYAGASNPDAVQIKNARHRLTLDGGGFTIYNLGIYTTVIPGSAGHFLRGLANSTVTNLTFANAKLVNTTTTALSLFGGVTYGEGSAPNNVPAAGNMCRFINFHVKDSLIYNNSDEQYQSAGASFWVTSTGGDSARKQPYMHEFSGCTVSGSFVYGITHISPFVSFCTETRFNNCASMDNIVVGMGTHSGGFVSCYDGYAEFTNCFSNTTMYSNRQTGIFCGNINAGIFKNCYTSGYIEGTEELGGFGGYAQTGHYSGDAAYSVNYGTTEFIDCYSTTMIGMQNGGKKLGGFMGLIRNGGNAVRPGIVFRNTYAAGETGSVDIDISSGRTTDKTVGGFVGGISMQSTTLTINSSFYDKQTTAMREWANGDSVAQGEPTAGTTAGAIQNTPMEGTGTYISTAGAVLSGVTGVLTTDTAKAGGAQGLASPPGAGNNQSFTGFTTGNGSNGNADWVFNEGMYPQLAAFVNATAAQWGTAEIAAKVRAYSRASVGTVFLNPYETDYKGDTLPDGLTEAAWRTTYDTVRDITQNVSMTDGGAAMTWEKGNAQIGAEPDPTVSLYGQTRNVAELLQNGTQYTATNLAPGIQWLTVKSTDSGATGQRALRLIPTSNLDVGTTRAVTSGESYDHADDVRMAYSTGPRMAVDSTDITQGVYPDSPMSTAQANIQNPLSDPFLSAFNTVNNQNLNVDVNHMSLNKAHTDGIASNASGGKMYISGTKGLADLALDNTTKDINDKFNAVVPFTNSDRGSYTLTYNWVLQDRRFLTGSKNFIVNAVPVPLPANALGSYIKFTGYDMANSINGNENMNSAGAYGTAVQKYFGNTYVDGNVWYTPCQSNRVMKQDAVTGKITGYPLSAMQNVTNASSTGTLKYHGPPAYDGRYLWFAPYQADRLLRLDPLDGSMVGFSMANGVNGNSGMTVTSSTSTTASKYSQIIFDGRALWLIPLESDRLVKVDISNMQLTGFPVMAGFALNGSGSTNMPAQASGTTLSKYEAAAYDEANNCFWMAPYNSNRVVKVSGLTGVTPTITGYAMTAGVNDITASCVGTTSAKFHGCLYVNGEIWMTPQYADRVVKITGLNGTPTFTGYNMTNGDHGSYENVGMTVGASEAGTSGKYHYAAYDGENIWISPQRSDRLVKVDPATGSMAGYQIPYYKSMTNDVPYYNPADQTAFNNYFNNNNWGMTLVRDVAKFSGICFDGNNLWLSPYGHDRVIKISPSADETLSYDYGTKKITAKLDNFMTQANHNLPFGEDAPTIDKIEWFHVDEPTDLPAHIAQYSYKGNTLSPYTDDDNPATGTAEQGFDYMYDLVSASGGVLNEDYGTVIADAGGSMITQSLTFDAVKEGIYYVKAYFTDPVNYYGEDDEYNEDRGTPQMVCVIKEINPSLPIKTAHVNGAAAEPGTEITPVEVERDDEITYDIIVSNPPPSGRTDFEPKLPQPIKIDFVNGSFEQPPVPAGSGYYQFPENGFVDPARPTRPFVPGWHTQPKPGSAPNAFERYLEYQIPGTNPQFATSAPDGRQYAELNCEVEGTLYQICNTTPGTRIYWEFYHGARGFRTDIPTNTDTLTFFLYGEGAQLNREADLQVTAVDSYTRGRPYIWGHYTGSYVVPKNQNRTVFAFESTDSTSNDPTEGNYLDGIRLYTQSYIDMTKSNNAPATGVHVDDIVTYTINAKNLGESDATGVTISDILPEGLELATSEAGVVQSAAGAGAPVNVPYIYNAVTRTITVNIGAGATNSQGGRIKGDGSFSEDCENEYILKFKVRVTDAGKPAYENQAKVVYADRNHEDQGGYTNYSNVDAFAAKAPKAAIITDQLPSGVTYLRHSDQGGSVSDYDAATNTVTWEWEDLPYGTTIVTITVEVAPQNKETMFENKADVTIGGVEHASNYTYHELATAILHLRQVVLGYSGGIMPPVSYKGFFNLSNGGLVFGVTVDSNKEELSTPFREFMVKFSNPSDMTYYIKDLVPQHYINDGYIITREYTPDDAETLDAHYPPLRTAGNDVEADFSLWGEYWVTMYIRPIVNPDLNDWDFETNYFGELYPIS